MMFARLRNRVLLLNMAVTSLVMAVAFGAIYLSTWHKVQEDTEKKLDAVNDTFLVLAQGKGSFTEDPEDLEPSRLFATSSTGKVTSDYSPSFVLTVDRDGNLLRVDSFIDMPDEFYIQSAKTAWTAQSPTRISFSGRTWVYKVTPVTVTRFFNGLQASVETMQDCFGIAFLDVTDSSKGLSELLATLALTGGGMLMAIFFVSLFFARRSVAPIALAWQKQEQFIADASHELKTPLAIIASNCDVLFENRKETIESQLKWLERVKSGTDRMARLINGLLTLAKATNADSAVDFGPFSMSEAASEALASIEATIEEKGLRVNANVPAGIDSRGDGEMAAQLIAILLDNAVKYTPNGGLVKVSLSKSRNRVTFCVQNSGDGIPQDELPKLFDRFYRADKSRKSSEGSFGLGLSIAKTIADRLGARLDVSSVENESTTFSFVL